MGLYAVLPTPMPSTLPYRVREPDPVPPQAAKQAKEAAAAKKAEAAKAAEKKKVATSAQMNFSALHPCTPSTRCLELARLNHDLHYFFFRRVDRFSSMLP